MGKAFILTGIQNQLSSQTGTRQMKALVPRCMGDKRKKLNLHLRQYAKVFKAEEYVINASAAENVEGSTRTGTSTFYHMVKLLSEHLTIITLILNLLR
jgi:ABC-type phosphate/phosphonate transport system ATPase subunit